MFTFMSQKYLIFLGEEVSGNSKLIKFGIWPWYFWFFEVVFLVLWNIWEGEL